MACTGVSDVWASIDGGDTWSHAVQGMSQQYTQDLSFVSADEGWAATAYSDEGESGTRPTGPDLGRHAAAPGARHGPAVRPLPRRVHGRGARCASGRGTRTAPSPPRRTAATPGHCERCRARRTTRTRSVSWEWTSPASRTAGVDDGAVMRTTDGGASWQLKRGLDGRFSATWSGVAAISASRCCLVGRSDRSNVIAHHGRRRDLAARQARRRSRPPLSSICFTDASHGWSPAAASCCAPATAARAGSPPPG